MRKFSSLEINENVQISKNLEKVSKIQIKFQKQIFKTIKKKLQKLKNSNSKQKEGFQHLKIIKISKIRKKTRKKIPKKGIFLEIKKNHKKSKYKKAFQEKNQN